MSISKNTFYIPEPCTLQPHSHATPASHQIHINVKYSGASCHHHGLDTIATIFVNRT
jgi:hypothetical protein